ncbi:metallophosphoesterase [Myroides guanonis]|uniref:Calcineurin-like phosphoesterase n=1 Tax=Myroides guanonis TaxID=1150112 RepID=A0A1I3PDW8_9FLAO|nr:metallophosphoesterase [Myroides guanonis]SFJ19520.1 Calcineurin-like phosphoesterase [Myroides guanonis]
MRVFSFLFLFIGSLVWAQSPKGSQIAFIADAHVHAVCPTLHDGFELDEFRDLDSGDFRFIRTLESQMGSTRLFNENFFAFKTVLNELADKGVRVVVLNGDYTDDGQWVNLKLVSDLLKGFSEKYGMRFLVTNGNHEAVNRVDRESGKPDFLDVKGDKVGVFSDSDLLKRDGDLVYEGMRELGYEGTFEFMKDFGLLPVASDLFYSTPFSDFDCDSYVFDASAFSLDERKYEIGDVKYPDFTYVVEPIEGVWLLGIDGNMYEKTGDNRFKNVSDGYHQLDKREYLFEWISMVVKEAKLRGKKLIAFGHYPILDFNNGQSEVLKELLGKSNFQLNRVPSMEIQREFLDTGLQIHFGGHMHINQHGVLRGGNRELWNIQVPSLAAFPPAYKVVTVEENALSVSTHLVKEVKEFDVFFKFYENPDRFEKVLSSKDYFSLTKSHLHFLTENRFFNEDFKDVKWDRFKVEALAFNFSSKKWNMFGLQHQSSLKELDFKSVLFDLYLIRNGNDLGMAEIDKERLALYKEWNRLNGMFSNELSDLDRLVTAIQFLIDASIPTVDVRIGM